MQQFYNNPYDVYQHYVPPHYAPHPPPPTNYEMTGSTSSMQLPPCSHSTTSTSSSEHSPSPHDNRSSLPHQSAKHHSPLKRSNSSATPRIRHEGSTMRRSDSLGGGLGRAGSAPYSKPLSRSLAASTSNPFTAVLPVPQLLQPVTINPPSSQASSPRKGTAHSRDDSEYSPIEHTSAAFFQSLNSGTVPCDSMELDRPVEMARRRQEVEDEFPQHWQQQRKDDQSIKLVSSKPSSPQLPPTPPAESLAAAFLDREPVPQYKFERDRSLPSRNSLSASTSSYFSPSHRSSGRLSTVPQDGAIGGAMFDPTMKLPPLDTLCSLPSIFEKPTRSVPVKSPSPQRRNSYLSKRVGRQDLPSKPNVGWSPIKESTLHRAAASEDPSDYSRRSGTSSRNSLGSPAKRSSGSTGAALGGAMQRRNDLLPNPFDPPALPSSIPSQPVLTLSSSPPIFSSSPIYDDVDESPSTIMADSTPRRSDSTTMGDSIFLLPSPSLETDTTPHIFQPGPFQSFSLAFDPSFDAVAHSTFASPQDDQRRDRRNFTYNYHPATDRIDETDQEAYAPAMEFGQEFDDFCQGVNPQFHDGATTSRVRRESISEAEDARVAGNSGWIAELKPVGLAAPTPSYPRLLSRVLGWGESLR